MSAQRAAPAYQEYAATMLASRDFRRMTATQRGIFYTMRLELWENKTLPADPAELGQMLGLNVDQVAQALPMLMGFFVIDGGNIRCAELDNYRAHLEERHLRQSKGGLDGASITNSKRKKPRRLKTSPGQGTPLDAATPTGPPPTTPTTTPTASLVQQSTAKQSPVRSAGKAFHEMNPESAAWLKAFTKGEECSKKEYLRSTRGD